MATITDNDLALFRERAKTELESTGDIGRIAWDYVVEELCKEVARLRSASKERGDCAKLREALKLCVDEMCNRCRELAVARGDTIPCLSGCEPIRKAKAALAAPPRNCDRFASVDEAHKAHEEYRKDYIMRASNKFDFPMEFEAWLFATATEKEGGAK